MCLLGTLEWPIFSMFQYGILAKKIQNANWMIGNVKIWALEKRAKVLDWRSFEEMFLMCRYMLSNFWWEYEKYWFWLPRIGGNHYINPASNFVLNLLKD